MGKPPSGDVTDRTPATCRFPGRGDDYVARVVGHGPDAGNADGKGGPVLALTSYSERGVRTTRSHVLCAWNADSSARRSHMRETRALHGVDGQLRDVVDRSEQSGGAT